jgi:hypothetical protein
MLRIAPTNHSEQPRSGIEDYELKAILERVTRINCSFILFVAVSLLGQFTDG